MPRKARERQPKDGQAIRYSTVKVRLYPTPEQEELFQNTFGCCRYIWNQMLADHERFYEETGKHFIPTPAKYKSGAPFLREVDNQALTQEYNQLAQAFKVFFKNPEAFGYPKFKKKKTDRDSFTAFNHPVYPTIWLTEDGIRMTKAGVVRARFSRRPRSGWLLKRITVERAKTGKYFCYILYEFTVKAPEPVVPTEASAIGLKYSMPHFYVADTGQAADPPHWLKQSQEKLARLQRQLCRMQPGSRNYEETARKYRLLHEHIANQRRDWLHKESRRIANAWDAVCVRADDMAAVGRLVSRGNVRDAGFGMFREMLRYKLERQGKQLVTVDRRFPSTRLCHECGYLEPDGIDPGRRGWRCPACGAALDREVNAARNIKAQGLALLGQSEDRQELRESA